MLKSMPILYIQYIPVEKTESAVVKAILFLRRIESDTEVGC